MTEEHRKCTPWAVLGSPQACHHTIQAKEALASAIRLQADSILFTFWPPFHHLTGSSKKIAHTPGKTIYAKAGIEDKRLNTAHASQETTFMNAQQPRSPSAKSHARPCSQVCSAAPTYTELKEQAYEESGASTKLGCPLRASPMPHPQEPMLCSGSRSSGRKFLILLHPKGKDISSASEPLGTSQQEICSKMWPDPG